MPLELVEKIILLFFYSIISFLNKEHKTETTNYSNLTDLNNILVDICIDVGWRNKKTFRKKRPMIVSVFLYSKAKMS